MKKIINGKKYDTETATYIDEYCPIYDRGNFNFYRQVLYQKKTKEFFLYIEGYGVGRGSGFDELIETMDEQETKDWLEIHSSADIYEALFGEVDE